MKNYGGFFVTLVITLIVLFVIAGLVDIYLQARFGNTPSTVSTK